MIDEGVRRDLCVHSLARCEVPKRARPAAGPTAVPSDLKPAGLYTIVLRPICFAYVMWSGPNVPCTR